MIFDQPCGPWRFGIAAARRDLVASGLGSYDESGAFFITVPGGIQQRTEWMSLAEELELSGAMKGGNAAQYAERLPVTNSDRLVRRVGRARL